MRIYLAFGGMPHGPYKPEQLSAMWQADQIPQDAFYWYDGMTSWMPAAQFQPPTSAPTRKIPASVILSTSPFLANREIESEVDIVTAECVFGMNVFRDLMTAVSDVFGGRSETTQDTLRRARNICLTELRKEAANLGADAVIAVDLDYSEISSQGKSMLMIVASGTAVQLQPEFPPLT